MKVLHLNFSDILGGAARGAYWLHSALRAQGVDSHMLVLRKESSDPTVHTYGHGTSGKLRQFILPRLDQAPSRFLKAKSSSYWTTGLIPSGICSAINELAPDIVHLHWVGAGLLSVSELARIRQPLVWTLRDMWAFTGGCHYTDGCERFENKCGRCHMLKGDHDYDLSRLTWTTKHRSWQNITVNCVAISHWLASCTEKSSLLKEQPIQVIPNGIDINVFRPIPKTTARDLLGLPPKEKIILFGALSSTHDRRKGFHKLKDAISFIANRPDTSLLIFGNKGSATPPLQLPTTYLGHLHDDVALRLAYSAADVMVVPSLQEAFGKTVIESMACATPVVAFNTGGPADIISHQQDGYLARTGDAQSLAEGITWCLEANDDNNSLGSAARQRVLKKYDITLIAKHYSELYAQLI